MIVLSYGFKQPENGDTGLIWFQALNDNITQVNSHDHDGANSPALNAGNVDGGSVTVSSASWVADVTGRYKQDKTCPAGFNMDDFVIETRITGSHVIYPSIDRLTATTFRIYSIYNTQDLTVVFR